LSLFQDAVFCLRPRCPVCRKGKLFKPLSVDVLPECGVCGAKLGAHDVGDGASVFLIFVLGFTVLPLAVVFSHFYAPPVWALLAVCGALVLGLVLLLLPTVKAFIILLEFRHLKKKE
jgi:uncharacterized protein (DUF983 family)